MKKETGRATVKVPNRVRDAIAKFTNGTRKKDKIALARAIAKGDPDFARQVFEGVLSSSDARSCCEKVRQIMEDWRNKDKLRRRAA